MYFVSLLDLRQNNSTEFISTKFIGTYIADLYFKKYIHI